MDQELLKSINDLIIDAQHDATVEFWQREVLRDFGSRIQVACGHMERGYEERKHSNPSVKQFFIEALALFHAIPGSIPTGVVLGKRIKDFFGKIWSLALVAIEDFISKHKEVLKVKSWSIGANFGFPAGVSGMVIVTFAD